MPLGLVSSHHDHTIPHLSSKEDTIKMALTSQRSASGCAKAAAANLRAEADHDVYASVQDMIHATIVYHGHRANLKEVYAACKTMGRIVCRKTGGWRWIGDNEHWKSQVRHTLYTSDRFARTENNPDYWEVTADYVSKTPQTTSPALLNFTGSGLSDTTSLHVMDTRSSPGAVVVVTRNNSCNWWQGSGAEQNQRPKFEPLDVATDSADELDAPHRSSDSGCDSFEGGTMQQHWMQSRRSLASAGSPTGRPARAASLAGQKRTSWDSSASDCHLPLSRQETRSNASSDLLELLAHAAASMTACESPTVRHHAPAPAPTLDLSRLLSNPAFAAGFLECRKLLSHGVLACPESPQRSDQSEPGCQAHSEPAPASHGCGVLSGMEGPLKKRFKVAAKSWTVASA